MQHAAKEVVNAIEDFINMTRMSKTDAEYKQDKERAKEYLIACFVRSWTVIAEKIKQAHEMSVANSLLDKNKPGT